MLKVLSYLNIFRLPLHWQIFLGMTLGAIFGYLINVCGGGEASAMCHPIFDPQSGALLGIFDMMGKIFLKLLKLVVTPLIFCALVNGISHMRVNQLGKTGLISLITFKGSMLIAACLGLFWVNIIKPGIGFDVTKLQTTEFHGDITPHSTADYWMQMIPTNFFDSLSHNEHLIQIILCAIVFGITISMLGDKAKTVSKFFDELFAIMLKIIHFIMLLAPIGVMGMLATNIGNAGFDSFLSIGKYMLTVALGLASMLFIVTPLLVWIFGGRMKPGEFFAGVKEAMLTSFGTSSTAATIPVSLECVTKNLGINKSLASFVIPTAATMNMNGAALYEGVVTLFLAQAYVTAMPEQYAHLDLSLGGQVMILTWVLISTLGTPGIPHGGLVTTAIVLQVVGLPLDSLGLILAVDRVLDMCRTMTNTTGDCASAVMINNLVGNKRFADDDDENQLLSDSELELMEESQSKAVESGH